MISVGAVSTASEGTASGSAGALVGALVALVIVWAVLRRRS
jgi:hypothetical protein